MAVGTAAAIDGVQRADLRAVLSIGGSLINLAIAWVAIPKFSILGVGFGLLAQQTFIIAGGWLVLRRHIANLGWLPTRWRRSIFRETLDYTVKLNAIAILSILFDPLVKFGLNGAEGTRAVGLYELAARLITQIRGLAAAAAIPLVPAFAAIREDDHERMARALETPQRAVAALSALACSGSLVGAPVLCWFVLGRISPEVITYAAILAIGWSVNILAIPLYLLAQGQGILRWNLASHLVLGLVIVLATWFGAPHFGAIAIVSGVTLGLVLSALVSTWGNAIVFRQASLIRRQQTHIVTAVAIVIVMCVAVLLIASKP